MKNESPVIVGEITGVFGVKGWVKVFSHTEPRLNIVKYNPWLLKQGKDWQSQVISQGKAQGKTIVAQLEGVDSREKAHALIGTKIAILPNQLASLPENEYYWRELEGLSVVNLLGAEIGIVSHLIETGANDVMVVKLPKQAGQKAKEMMIPYIPDQVIKRIDLDEKVIEVEWDDDYL